MLDLFSSDLALPHVARQSSRMSCNSDAASLMPSISVNCTKRSFAHGRQQWVRARRLRRLVLVAPLAMGCGEKTVERSDYPHDAEPIGTVRASYDGALSAELAVSTFRNIHRLFPSRAIAPATKPFPLHPAATPLGAVTFTAGGRPRNLEDYVRDNRVTGLLVLKDGRIALERYERGNTPRTRWMSMSIAKSVTSTLIGAAIQQGRITSLSDSVTRYVPALRGSAYEGVSVRDVLMMSSGVKWDETYTDPASDRRRLLEAQLSQQPGAALDVIKSLTTAAVAGSRNNYSTGETQVAGEIVRGAVGENLARYLAERIWSRFGMEAEATWWLTSANGIEVGGSGISATLRDYGRLGLFMLADGIAGGERILPEGWIKEATTPKLLRDGSPINYGYMWWPGTSESARRDGAYTAQGIHGQSLYVNPTANVVIVVWSAQPWPTGGAVINDMAFFEGVVAALADAQRNTTSRVIEAHGRLAMPDELRRLGKVDPRFWAPMRCSDTSTCSSRRCLRRESARLTPDPSCDAQPRERGAPS